MANNEYLLAANSLRERARERLGEGEKSAKENEVNKLFHWILNQLESDINNIYPAQRYAGITFEEVGKIVYYYGRPRIVFKVNDCKYISEFVNSRKEFLQVIEEVKNILNETEGFMVTAFLPEEDAYMAHM